MSSVSHFCRLPHWFENTIGEQSKVGLLRKSFLDQKRLYNLKPSQNLKIGTNYLEFETFIQSFCHYCVSLKN